MKSGEDVGENTLKTLSLLVPRQKMFRKCFFQTNVPSRSDLPCLSGRCGPKGLPMSFGKNPHVPKAQAAEQKALDATDDHSRALAYREAGHLWDRAAERESPGKRRSEYERNAARARALADGGDEEANSDVVTTVDPKSLN